MIPPNCLLVMHSSQDDSWVHDFATTLRGLHWEVSSISQEDRAFLNTSCKCAEWFELTDYPVLIAILSPSFLRDEDLTGLVTFASIRHMQLNKSHNLYPEQNNEYSILFAVANACNVPHSWKNSWRSYTYIAGAGDSPFPPKLSADLVHWNLTEGRLVPRNRANKAYQRATDLLNAGRGQEALDSFDLAIELEPESAYYVAAKAEAFRKLGRPGEALTMFDAAISLEPENAFLYVQTAFLFYEIGEYSTAVSALEHAIEWNPDDAFTWNLRGQCLLFLQQPLEALACFERTLGIERENPLAWHGVSQACAALGRRQEAAIAAERAKELGLR